MCFPPVFQMITLFGKIWGLSDRQCNSEVAHWGGSFVLILVSCHLERHNLMVLQKQSCLPSCEGLYVWTTTGPTHPPLRSNKSDQYEPWGLYALGARARHKVETTMRQTFPLKCLEPIYCLSIWKEWCHNKLQWYFKYEIYFLKLVELWNCDYFAVEIILHFLLSSPSLLPSSLHPSFPPPLPPSFPSFFSETESLPIALALLKLTM